MLSRLFRKVKTFRSNLPTYTGPLSKQKEFLPIPQFPTTTRNVRAIVTGPLSKQRELLPMPPVPTTTRNVRGIILSQGNLRGLALEQHLSSSQLHGLNQVATALAGVGGKQRKFWDAADGSYFRLLSV